MSKVKVEIKQELYDSLAEKYEKEKLSLTAININNPEEFIEYILKNFDVSSKQFESLTDQQKNAFSNIDFNNIDINDLVKTLSDSLSSTEEKKVDKIEDSTKKNKN
ncbi:MAG: hypothetical protein ACRCVI_03245 [Mycoplasmoidaceae bacterium]